VQNLKDTLRQMLRDVRGQRLRTFLTIFGIVWGTVAVTLLLAFGQGLQKQMIKNTAGLGDRICIVWPGLTSIPYEGLGRGRRIRLNEEHIESVRREAKGIKAVSPEYTDGLQLKYGVKTVNVGLSGAWPSWGAMRNMIPQPGGRFLNDIDEAEQRRVAFFGEKIARDIFGAEPPVGKIVQIHGSPFTVIGVLIKKEQDGSYSGPDEGRVIIPASTYRALTGEKWIDNFIVQPTDPQGSEKVMDEVRSILSRSLRFDPEDKEALSTWDTTEQFKFFDIFFLSFRLFLGIIGAFTLIVGGIGVSNIMNVVVEERTREIGIKMALGARQKFILRQFLLETMLLTSVGGAIGFLLSFAICAAFPKLGFTEFVGDPEISFSVAAATATILGLTGLLAGYFPAREASRLDPVVAMKL
jgi:putative ABC transport system permease protein